MNWTTRRYSRRLGEAYPADATYACALERPGRTSRLLRTAASAAALVIGIGLVAHTVITLIRSPWQ